MPQIVHRPVNRTRADCSWLLQYRRNTNSQIGQDGILEKIFEVIGPGGTFCVEFGAWDGRHLSNTWNLIANQNWNAILVEGNPERCAQIAQTHPYPRVKTVNAFVGWEGERSLDNILSACGAPPSPDLVSIDVDGNDWHIWRSLQRHRPRVILIEFNPTVPNDVFFVQDADPEVNQGSSLLSMIELGKTKGYSLVCANLWDAFFVLDDLYPAFAIPDNGIDAMYHYPEMETRLFQGYDGTLLTAGNHRLVWKDIAFSAEDLQVLPRSLRRFT